LKPFALSLLLIGTLAPWACAQDMVVYGDALENGWQDYSWATIDYANTSPVHAGGNSIRVSDPGTSSQALFLHHNAFDPSPYQSLSFWICPTAAGTDELQVKATLHSTPQTAVMLSFTTAQVNQWQQINIPLSSLGVAGNAGFDGFWIQNNTGGPLAFYVDDISLAAAPPPNPVPVTVNAQSVIRTIDSRIFGMNITIWDQYLGGAATADLMTAMDTRVLRFPGGSDSDDYDWQTDRLVSNGSYQWVNNAATFARVAEARAAQAYVTVNYGSGTPEQAAAWVAYYNGNASNTAVIGADSKGRDWKTVGYWASLRGAAPLATDDGFNFLRASHPAPFGFRYWEIGNECYGTWEYDLHGTAGSGLSGVAHDPYTYAQAFQAFSNKMLAVDPSIRIGAVATPGENAYGIGTHAVANPNESNSQHSGWTPVVIATLKSLGVTPHFLSHHSYAQEPGSESDAVLLQAGATLESDATNLRKMIADYVGGSSGGSIELAVTELNSVSTDPGKQSTSLVNGLFLADALGHLARTEFNACTWWALRGGAGANANNSASLYGWRPYGDYGVVSAGDVPGTAANTPFPPFYAAKLLTNWGRGGDSVVSTTSGYGLLAIHAAKLANGNLALLVVNKHPDADLTARITLNNFTPGSATARIFSYGKQNDLTNGDLTTGTANIPGATFSYTFPAYSMSVLVVKGQFENWREGKFTTAELSNWPFSGDTGQPARDGIPNLMKYALGLDPKTPVTSGLPTCGQTPFNGRMHLTLTFAKLRSLSDITYDVQVSGDLQSWQSGPLYTIRADDGTTDTAIFRDLSATEDTPRRFMRLHVTRP
jgi:alpha-N-arabinofuranosidase